MSQDSDYKLDFESESFDPDETRQLINELMGKSGFIPIGSVVLSDINISELEKSIQKFISGTISTCNFDKLCAVDSVLYRAILSLWDKREGHKPMSIYVISSLIHLVIFHSQGIDWLAERSLSSSFHISDILSGGDGDDKVDSSSN